jgi:hypothetical protein
MKRSDFYLKYYNSLKNYSLTALAELRAAIVEQVRFGAMDKSMETSVKLEVIDDLSYLKHYGIEV